MKTGGILLALFFLASLRAAVPGEFDSPGISVHLWYGGGMLVLACCLIAVLWRFRRFRMEAELERAACQNQTLLIGLSQLDYFILDENGRFLVPPQSDHAWVVRNGVPVPPEEWIYPEERIYVSESFFRLCGFDRPTQFISMAERAELIHPDDIEYEHEQMAEAVASRSLADFQIRLRHKDGYYFPVRIRGKVYPADTAARAFCIVGTVRDISEELVSRERIAQLNSRLNSALLLTGEIVFEISCPELVVRSNISPNLQLAGFPVSFLTMRPLNSFLSGVEFEQLRAWMNATPDTYTNSETFRLDITLSLENLLSIPVRLVFRKGTRDGQKILVMNVRDLSAEQGENIRLTILKTVFEQLDSAFVVARLSGGVYCYNDAAGQIFPGIRENRKIWDFLPEFDETKYQKLWDAAKINSVQILTFRRDGVPYEAVCSRLNVASGFLCIQYKRMP